LTYGFLGWAQHLLLHAADRELWLPQGSQTLTVTAAWGPQCMTSVAAQKRCS
jgi:hypothetical protein